MNLLYANDRRGEYPQSWYAETATPLAPFPPLRGETRADLCIIGAGYTGLSAALTAARAGLSVVVLDAHRVGFGASGRNGGQLGSGFNQSQQELERAVGIDDARKLWDMAEAAKALTRGYIDQFAPKAGYKPGIIHAVNKPGLLKEYRQEAEHCRSKYGYDQIELLDRDALQPLVSAPDYHGGTLDMGAGHIHPLRYAIGLAEGAVNAGAVIHEQSPVHQIKQGKILTIQTETGRVIADFGIIATNGYHAGLEKGIRSRVMPINNFIVATEPLGDRMSEVLPGDAAVADNRFVINYFRKSEDGRLLFGGGETYGYKFPNDIASLVRKPLEEVFPQLKGVQITHAWGGTLAITMSRLPHVARRRQTLYPQPAFPAMALRCPVSPAS